MARISAGGRIGQQVGVKKSVYQVSQDKAARRDALQQAQKKTVKVVEKKQTKEVVLDHDAIWKKALTTFNKGKAWAYLSYIKPGGRSPQNAAEVRLKREYLKNLVKQQKAGNILPEEIIFKNIKRARERQTQEQGTTFSGGTGYSVAPEFKKSLSKVTTEKIVPSNFIGPLRRGTVREAAPESSTISPITGMSIYSNYTLDKYRKARDTASNILSSFSKYHKGKILGLLSKDVAEEGSAFTKKKLEQARAIPIIKIAREKIKKSGFEEKLTGAMPKPTNNLGSGDSIFFEKILGSDPNITPLSKYKTGEDLSLRYGHIWAGNKLSDFVVGTLKKKEKSSAASLLSTPAPSWLSSAVAEFPTWSAFGPFMKTGTAQVQESKYVYDYKKGKYVTKKEAMEKLTSPKVEKSGKTITVKGLTYSDKAERISRLLSKANTIEQKKAIIKLAEETYGKNFVKEYASQEFGAYIPTSSTSSIQTAIAPKMDIPSIPLPRMENLEYIETIVSSIFQPSKINKQSGSQWISSMDTKQPSVISYMVPPQTTTAQDVAQETDVAQDVFQSTAQSPSQTQTPSLETPTIQVPTIPTTTTTTATTTAVAKTISPADPTTISRIYPFWLPSLSPVIKPKKKKSGSFIPQVKSKNKWKTVGKRMDRNSALSRASYGADVTISRRFRIKPSNKSIQVKGISGWGVRQHKFRAYGKNKLSNQYIERKQFAIDTPTEKSGLSIGKLSKQMNWGINMQPEKRKKKKSSTKKRKTKSPWLV